MEDFVQETFVKVVKNIHKFKSNNITVEMLRKA
ncbi:hypothetical protein FZC75_00800 [Sutcliffiella horikoshii]|uniref:Uncharacterized protein n=1 Tax=Sutcliffiella horikoshii TaxID=79883 RepID=A0A5D4TF65_9BACI|nr:hypothetical protein FZC75_00800 [Sutcliffiella horikoshii]